MTLQFSPGVIMVSSQDNEQRWPLFKAVSLARPEQTPELSAQEKQSRNGGRKPLLEVREHVTSLPVTSEKQTISLAKISKQVSLGDGQPSVGIEHAKKQSEYLVGRHDEPQQLVSNNVSTPNITTTASTPTPITPEPELLKPQVDVLTLEVEPRSAELAAVRSVEAMSDLQDTERKDDSLQSLFSRIQGKDKVAIKPAEKRSSFFERLRKR